MGDHITKQAIRYYEKAQKGSEKDYDRFIDYVYSLKKCQVVPIMNWLIKNKSKYCLLDMLVHSLTYEENQYESLRKSKSTKRIGTIYHLSELNTSRKSPSE